MPTAKRPRTARKNAAANKVVGTTLKRQRAIQSATEHADEQIQKFGKSSVMGRPAQPEELAPAYVRPELDSSLRSNPHPNPSLKAVS